MKRRKLAKGVALGAALTGVTLGFAGCRNMQVQDVYGPPPEAETQLDAEEATTFAPEDMEIPTEYGPPPDEYVDDDVAETELTEDEMPSEEASMAE